MSGWLSDLGSWIEFHPGDASWVQALGATLAVIAAVLVPARQAQLAKRRQEADRRLRAKSLAIAIYPELLHIRAAYRHIHRRFLALIDRKQREQGLLVAEMSRADLAGNEQGYLVPVTEALRALVPQIYLLGEPVGPQVQRCIGRSMKYNDLMRTVLETRIRIDTRELPAFLEGGLQQVEACIASIEQTWRVTADEAHAFEDHIISDADPMPVSEGETRSKETV